MLHSTLSPWLSSRRARRFAEAKLKRRMTKARREKRRLANFLMYAQSEKWRPKPKNHRRAPQQDRRKKDKDVLDPDFTEEEIKPRPDPQRQDRADIPGEKVWEETRRCAAAWKEEGAGTVVMKWITEGARADWQDGPPPPFRQTTRPMSKPKMKFLQGERDRWLAVGAAKAATDTTYVSACHLVPKPGKNKFRIVSDYRHLNSYMTEKGCRYETLKVLRRLTRRNNFFMSVDLKDGYFTVGIKECDQK